MKKIGFIISLIAFSNFLVLSIIGLLLLLKDLFTNRFLTINDLKYLLSPLLLIIGIRGIITELKK